MILADGNKAGPYGPATPRYLWNPERAAATAAAFAELGVGWLEEPLPADQHVAMAALRAQRWLPIAGGENCASFAGFERMIAGGCVDIVNPEVMLIGPSLCREVAALASTHDIQCVGHMGHGGLGTLCALHLNASWSASGWAELIHEPPVADYRHSLAPFTPVPALAADGTMSLGEAPGLGVELLPEFMLADPA